MTAAVPPRESSQRGPALRIVAVNDVYSLENLPRLATLVEHHRKNDPADRLLVTLAGDFLAPSILSSLDSGRGMVECMNAIGFTHVIFGNHEDDVSTTELRRRIAELRAVWINTNVPNFDPPLPTYDIVEITHIHAGNIDAEKVRVALIGVVMGDSTAYHRKPFGGVDVEPANDSALLVTKHLLESRKADWIIPLTHQPIADDRELARRQRTPPYLVIVGGHEHIGTVEEIDGTSIVKASADAIHAIVIDIAWPATSIDGSVASRPSVTIRRDDVAGYAENTVLRALVDKHMTRVEELEAATLVKLAPDEVLSSKGTRSQQTSLGSLLASRVRDSVGADGCVFNGGGIRANCNYHHRFTYGDLKAEVPFDNEIVVISLPGDVIAEAIRASRAFAPRESGGFLQIDDRMTVDPVTGSLTHIDERPLDPNRDYRIALVRDLLLGMDHEEPLVRFARAHPEKIPPAGSGRDVKIVLVDAFAKALWSKLGAFEAIDTDHDGLIDRKELGAAIFAHTHEPVSPIAIDLVIHALDTDRDAEISRAEADAVPITKKPSSVRE